MYYAIMITCELDLNLLPKIKYLRPCLLEGV